MFGSSTGKSGSAAICFFDDLSRRKDPNYSVIFSSVLFVPIEASLIISWLAIVIALQIRQLFEHIDVCNVVLAIIDRFTRPASCSINRIIGVNVEHHDIR